MIKRRDVAALLTAVSDDIIATFGSEGEGKREFVATWGLNRPTGSRLWSELSKALALGCAKSGDALVSPSIIAQIDPMTDGYKAFLATVPGTALRKAANDSAPVVATLDWDLLMLEDRDADKGWLALTLADGRSGFVRTDRVRSVIDYRAVFERRNGQWLMTTFVAGD